MAQSQISPVAEPLYEQVYRIFRSKIIGGEWKQRSLLPGEVVLSQDLGVSVGTVRKAMDQLARDNLVIRERGRGTFVRGDDEWQDAKGLKLFDLAGRLIVPVVEMVEARLASPTESEARLLRIEGRPAEYPQILRMSRHWRYLGLVVNREDIAVDAGRFPALAALARHDGAGLQEAYCEAVLDRIERTVWSIGMSEGCGAARNFMAPPLPGNAAVSVLHLGSLALDARGVPLEIGRHEIQLDNCALQLNG